jgi:hypothetical protein
VKPDLVESGKSIQEEGGYGLRKALGGCFLRQAMAQKRKTALKPTGRSLQSSETFVSELSFRTSSGRTAQGTVVSPARLPQPFQVAHDD